MESLSFSISLFDLFHLGSSRKLRGGDDGVTEEPVIKRGSISLTGIPNTGDDGATEELVYERESISLEGELIIELVTVVESVELL